MLKETYNEFKFYKMKKILGILGVVMIAATMFFSSNVANTSNGNLNLAGLININTANAEDNCPCYDTYTVGGTWAITKCNGCTEVLHVKVKQDPSTCPCNK